MKKPNCSSTQKSTKRSQKTFWKLKNPPTKILVFDMSMTTEKCPSVCLLDYDIIFSSPKIGHEDTLCTSACYYILIFAIETLSSTWSWLNERNELKKLTGSIKACVWPANTRVPWPQGWEPMNNHDTWNN